MDKVHYIDIGMTQISLYFGLVLAQQIIEITA